MEEYYYQNEEKLRLFCLLHNIDSIYVDFDGSGDSGCIDAISVNTDQAHPLLKLPFAYTEKNDARTVYDPEKKAWVTERPDEFLTKTVPFRDFLEHHVDVALSASGVDWYNNAGGYGQWTWGPITGVQFSIEQRYTETRNAWYEVRNLAMSEDETDELESSPHDVGNNPVPVAS